MKKFHFPIKLLKSGFMANLCQKLIVFGMLHHKKNITNKKPKYLTNFVIYTNVFKSQYLILGTDYNYNASDRWQGTSSSWSVCSP